MTLKQFSQQLKVGRGHFLDSFGTALLILIILLWSLNLNQASKWSGRWSRERILVRCWCWTLSKVFIGQNIFREEQFSQNTPPTLYIVIKNYVSKHKSFTTTEHCDDDDTQVQSMQHLFPKSWIRTTLTILVRAFHSDSLWRMCIVVFLYVFCSDTFYSEYAFEVCTMGM